MTDIIVEAPYTGTEGEGSCRFCFKPFGEDPVGGMFIE